jgi:putative transcriptional regulator
MTAKQRRAATQADPDNRPMTDEAWAAAPRVPRVSTIRRALKLSQEEFADAFHIPIGTLRDWERAGRSQTLRPGPTCTLSHGSRRRCAKHYR